mmetsp:Transcript_11372/g.28678  ORF Transcript_11372/g.28678 Transcript_11372/m.28678 type:complete len:213 (+) Transcript_11372:375-1013(+)
MLLAMKQLSHCHVCTRSVFCRATGSNTGCDLTGRADDAICSCMKGSSRNMPYLCSTISAAENRGKWSNDLSPTVPAMGCTSKLTVSWKAKPKKKKAWLMVYTHTVAITREAYWCMQATASLAPTFFKGTALSTVWKRVLMRATRGVKCSKKLPRKSSRHMRRWNDVSNRKNRKEAKGTTMDRAPQEHSCQRGRTNSVSRNTHRATACTDPPR